MSSLSILASFASLIHQGSSPDLENALECAPSLRPNNENQRPIDFHHSTSRRPHSHSNGFSESNHYSKPHSNHHFGPRPSNALSEPKHYSKPHSNHHHHLGPRPSNVLSESNHYSNPHYNHHFGPRQSTDGKLHHTGFAPGLPRGLGRSPRKVSLSSQDYAAASAAPKARHSTKSQVSHAVNREVLPHRHPLGTKRKSRDYDDDYVNLHQYNHASTASKARYSTKSQVSSAIKRAVLPHHRHSLGAKRKAGDYADDYFNQYNYDDEDMAASSLDDDDIMSDPDDSLIMTVRNWSSKMDKALARAVEQYGEDNWKQVAAVPVLHKKTPKQCQYRWTENLKETNSGPLTSRECEIIMENHDMRGNQWKVIAEKLPNRTSLFVKHIWGEFISTAIMQYLALNRGVDVLALQFQCVRKETHRGRFDYKAGELRGAITYVTHKVSTMNAAAISFRRPSIAGSRTKQLKRKKYNHWSIEEDETLRQAVEKLGTDSWMQVALSVSGRNNKQCQERWQNHLDPDVNKKPITDEERRIIEQLQAEHGDQPKMTDFVNLLPGRTAIFSRNNWHNILRKKARQEKCFELEQNATSWDSY